MKEPVSSIDLARQLMKTWNLPNSITNMSVTLGVGINPEVTVSYLVSQEDAVGFLHLMKHYHLVEKDEQIDNTFRESEV